MQLKANEIELVGMWVAAAGRVRADETCERIEWLTTHHLRKVASSKESGGWDTLYEDPDGQQFWEKTYPESGMHGGGPPRLSFISREQAKAKYQWA